MKASQRQRCDLVVGALGSVIAIVGLLLSVVAGNTMSAGFGIIDLDTQKALAWLAGVFAVLILIKAGIRCRGGTAEPCPRGFHAGYEVGSRIELRFRTSGALSNNRASTGGTLAKRSATSHSHVISHTLAFTDK